MADEIPGVPMNPVLDEFRQLFNTPESKEWADEQAVRLNDYVTRKAIADASDQASKDFAANFRIYGDSLINAVDRDPQFTDTAMDMAQAHVEYTFRTNPNIPDDQREEAFNQILGELNRGIADAAVRSYGNIHEDLARSMLEHPRVSAALKDTDKQGLNDYIDMQTLARSVDAGAQERLDADMTAVQETGAALSYAASLYDPEIDDARFPQQWAQKMMRDPDVSPQARADLLKLYARMQTTGDVPNSDPLALADAVAAIANGNPVNASTVFNETGSAFKLADALMLAKGTMPQTPAQKAEWKEFNDVIQEGRRTIASPENGVAGVNAFRRFMNWLAPQYRRAGPGSLQSTSDNYLFMNIPEGTDIYRQFAPTLDDFPAYNPPEGERPSLQEIFARGAISPYSDSLRRQNERNTPGGEPIENHADMFVPHARGRNEFGEPIDAEMEIRPGRERQLDENDKMFYVDNPLNEDKRDI